MRKKLSIPLGLAIFFIIVPLVNAQVGDQNGIPPTDALVGIIVNGTEWLGGSYASTFEFIAGDGISLDLDDTAGSLMINSTLTQNIAQISYFNYTSPHTVTISAITVDGETNMFVVDAPTHDHSFNSNFDMPSDGRLRYTGELTMNFVINGIATMTLDGNNNDVVLAIAKNGIVDDHGRIVRTFGSAGDTGATAVQVIEELQQNDYIELYIGNLDATNDVIFNSVDIRILSPAHGEPGTQFGFLDSIHTIGNVTNSGCAENEILKVDATGTFVCAADGGGGGSGEINTASNLSPGEGIFAQKNLLDLEFKSLVGEGVTISSNSTSVILNVTGGGGSGEVNTASNLNEGTGIFASKVGDDLQFKSLLNGSGIIFTENSTNIMINSTSTRDQTYWNEVLLTYDEGALFLGLDGEAYDVPVVSSLLYQTIITKPLYLDYIEFYIASNSISSGDYRFRVIDNGVAITGDFIMDIGSASAGDTFRYELDVQVNPGDLIFIDSECTSGSVCNSGQAWYTATMEYYAVDDATYYDGWTFQDDNLGNHTATQSLDMDGNSIQNALWFEREGTVSSQGALRLGFGDEIGWRNSLGTDDIYIDTLGLDVLAFQINTEQVATLSTSDLDLKDNNLELGSGRVGFDDFDTAIQQDGSDLDIRTGGDVIIDVGGTNEYSFNATYVDYNDNGVAGSRGCIDGEHLVYSASNDEWGCWAAGGRASEMLGFSAWPAVVAPKATQTYIAIGSHDTSTTATDIKFYIGHGGDASYLQCWVSASGTNANTVIYLTIDGVDSGMFVQYTSGLTGYQRNNISSIAVAQGDYVSISADNLSFGGGAKDLEIDSCTVRISYDP